METEIIGEDLSTTARMAVHELGSKLRCVGVATKGCKSDLGSTLRGFPSSRVEAVPLTIYFQSILLSMLVRFSLIAALTLSSRSDAVTVAQQKVEERLIERTTEVHQLTTKTYRPCKGMVTQISQEHCVEEQQRQVDLLQSMMTKLLHDIIFWRAL